MRFPIQNNFSLINKTRLTSICKRLHRNNVLVHDVPTSVYSVLRLSPGTPLSARCGGSHLQIKMCVVCAYCCWKRPDCAWALLSCHSGKSLSCTFPGGLAWTETLGKRLFFERFWPFKWLIFLEVFNLLSLQAFLLYYDRNEKNNWRTRF